MSATALDRSQAPPPGEIRPFEFPSVERFTLGNGLRVLFARTTGLPVTTLSLILPSGATREPASRAGLARLTATLLESGTEDLSAAEISERLEGMGVRLHSGTSWEISHVDFTALTEKVGDASRLMAELVRASIFPEPEVERLRNEQLASILQRRAEPRGFANELASHFLFADGSPYSRPISGNSATVAPLTRDEVVAFHRSTYTPRAAALIVAGNIERDRLWDALENAFGDWTGNDAPPANYFVEPRFEDSRVVIVHRPRAVQSELRMGHIGVSRDTPDYFPIVVMNTVLGGAFSSRLNMNLRERHGFTYGVRSGFSMRKQPGPFLVSTAVQTEVTAAAAREIVHELRQMRSGPVTDDELADARQYVAGTFPLLLQTTDGIASRLAEQFIYDLPHSYLEDFASRILSVEAKDVQRVADQYLQPDQLVTVILGDAEKIRTQLQDLEIGPVETVTPESVP